MGYLSNKYDSKLLLINIKKIADKISEAVIEYFDWKDKNKLKFDNVKNFKRLH